jgi:alkyldihydroxyacetonephosphate synthase
MSVHAKKYDRRNLKWNGWGWNDATYDLKGHDDELFRVLSETTGATELPATPSVDWEAIPLKPSRIAKRTQATFAASLSAEAVVAVDAYERIFHSMGRSYYDLLRLRAGQLSEVFDLVVYPACVEDVQAVVRACVKNGWALVPFGGGSSVVGGVEAEKGEDHKAIVCLDMTRMGRVLEVDRYSLVARVEAGCYGPVLEETLQRQGLTLGHYPQSFEFSTIGGWIAARSSGQQSNRYGTAAAFLVSARMVMPSGELRTLDVPKTAAGPSLLQVIAGSEGMLGVIVDVTVRLHAVPTFRDYRGVLFPSFGAGAEAIRRIVQAGIPAAMLRLSDEDETHFLTMVSTMSPRKKLRQKLLDRVLQLRGMGTRPCILLLGVEEDDAAWGAAARDRALSIARECGGFHVGAAPGTSWYAGRFNMPYLRDIIMDRALGVDTLETSALWDNLDATYQAVRGALLRELNGRGAVMTHISHSYSAGSSLYFTFFFARDLDDEVGQWERLKRAASDAIAQTGATISHHHGVGRDHAPWMAAEVGESGLELLRGLKHVADPTGILNPGKLLPPR